MKTFINVCLLDLQDKLTFDLGSNKSLKRSAKRLTYNLMNSNDYCYQKRPHTNAQFADILIASLAATLIRAWGVSAHCVIARTSVVIRALILIDVALTVAPAQLAHASSHAVTPLRAHTAETRGGTFVAEVEVITG